MRPCLCQGKKDVSMPRTKSGQKWDTNIAASILPSHHGLMMMTIIFKDATDRHTVRVKEVLQVRLSVRRHQIYSAGLNKFIMPTLGCDFSRSNCTRKDLVGRASDKVQRFDCRLQVSATC